MGDAGHRSGFPVVIEPLLILHNIDYRRCIPGSGGQVGFQLRIRVMAGPSESDPSTDQAVGRVAIPEIDHPHRVS